MKVSLESAAQECEFRRKWNSPTVLVNGCFDILHLGHVTLLEQAKALGGAGATLVVAVNSDSSVRALKGPLRPIIDEKSRLSLVDALGSVDFVLLFSTMRMSEVIRAIRPNLWVKGGTYTLETIDAGEKIAADEVGAEIVFTPLTGHESTSTIIRRIADTYSHELLTIHGKVEPGAHKTKIPKSDSDGGPPKKKVTRKPVKRRKPAEPKAKREAV